MGEMGNGRLTLLGSVNVYVCTCLPMKMRCILLEMKICGHLEFCLNCALKIPVEMFAAVSTYVSMLNLK